VNGTPAREDLVEIDEISPAHITACKDGWECMSEIRYAAKILSVFRLHDR
jgi:ABC-type proline/glycine betaine transport system substrate-binding protein